MSSLPVLASDPQDKELSESCRDNILRECRELWRGHQKKEMIISAFSASASAVIVGLLAYLFVGSTMPWWAAIIAGILAALIAVPITLLIIYTYYRFIEAPSSLYKKSVAKIRSIELLLEAERAKEAKPEITGKIREFYIREGAAPFEWSTYVVIKVYLVNRASTTTIQEYRLKLMDNGNNHEGWTVPIRNVHLTRIEYQARGLLQDALEVRVHEDLVDLQELNLIPLERYVGREGWLQFSVSPQFTDAMEVTLTVLDATDEVHLITASAPWSKSGTLEPSAP